MHLTQLHMENVCETGVHMCAYVCRPTSQA